jgi:hypothetical protein
MADFPSRLFRQLLSSGIIATVFNTPFKAVNHFTLPSATRSLAAVAALAASCLAGCSRHEAPAVQRPAPARPAAVAAAPLTSDLAVEAPSVGKAQEAALMQAIFGDDYHAQDGAAVAQIETGENEGYWRMTLYAAKRLPDGRTAVVVNGAPSDENGGDAAAHASPGMLNVYTLRQADGAWQVIERHREVSTMGSSGNIGMVKWIDLGAGKTGIVVSSGGTWFGSTIAIAEIFDLDHGMRSLGGFKELSSNAGGCMPETADCWDVDGKIGTVPAPGANEYRDIVVSFEGKHFRVTEDAKGDLVEHPTHTVRQTARYRFNGKEYVLVSGENPVPPIG